MFRKVILLLSAVLCCVAFSTIAGNDAAKISASGKAIKLLKADFGKVIVGLSAQSISATTTATEAENKFQEKYAALEKALKEKYKDINIEQITIGICPKQQSNYNQANPYTPRPKISKLLVITIPADEKIAVDVIDIALDNGAVLRPDMNFYKSKMITSTVIYGIKDEAAVEKQVRQMAVSDMIKTAKESASFAGRKIGKMLSLSIRSSAGSYRITHYPSIDMLIGVEFFSADPDRVCVSATARGFFSLED